MGDKHNVYGYVRVSSTDKLSADNMLVLHIAEDGTITEKEFSVNEDEKIAVKTTESGTYIVVDQNTSDDNQDAIDQEQDQKGNMLWMIIAVAVVVLIIGSVVVVMVMKKKKGQRDS